MGFLLFEVRQNFKLRVNEKFIASRYHGPHIFRLRSVILSPDRLAELSTDFVNAATYI